MIHRCNARTRSCRNCGHRYSKEEGDIWTCPECGEDRHCQKAVKEEGMRCRLHGGASLKGPAAPAWRHGRYSTQLPPQLRTRYDAAISDPELLALRDEVALLDARLGELLSSLGVSGSSETWKELSETFSRLRHAITERDPQEANAMLAEMDRLLKAGQNDAKVWEETYRVVEQRRKVVESERRRLVEMQQMITTEQAMVLIARVQELIIEHVTDRDALAGISAGLRAFTVYDAR